MVNKKIFMSRPGVFCAAGRSLPGLWKSVSSAHRDSIVPVQTAAGKSFYAAHIPDDWLEASGARYDMRIIRIEKKALDQIEKTIQYVKARYGQNRIAVCAGSCDNGSEFSVAAHRSYFSSGVFPLSYELEMQGAGYVASYIQERFGLGGPALAFSTACSSSASAAVKAAELIRAGIADAVITGGVDIASDTVLLGFNALEAVSPEPTNPFSRNRKGITLGDGAAFFVLAKDPFPEEDCTVTLAGYGESADAYHVTSPEPEGNGAAAAMTAAFSSAGIAPEDIGYLNLHGTGTKLNDSMEAAAVHKAFGSYAVPCSSTKSETGHTLGAAGALEAAVCYAALANSRAGGTVSYPLQAWDGEADEGIPQLNIIDARSPVPAGNAPLRCCMSNSFAFGGANVSLIFALEQDSL